MDPQVSKIVPWLQEKLGVRSKYLYEVNARNTDILFRLAECNECRDRDVSLVIEDLKLKTKETAATANDLYELLMESIGPSFTSFSRTASSYRNELVECALVLDIKNTSLSSYALAIEELTTNLFDAEYKNKQLADELVNLREQFTAALELNKSLEQDLKMAEAQFAEEASKLNVRDQEMNFLNAKSNESVIRIRMAKEQLSDRGMDPSLSHSSLVAQSEKLEKLKEETVQLNTKLQSYMDLSPNLAFAELKLDAARKEAAELEAELAEKVDMLSRNMPYAANRKQT